MVALAAEAADLKKVLKTCEKAMWWVCGYWDNMTYNAKDAVEIFIDRHEVGFHVQMAAEFAWFFKKTMDKQQLDETIIENLIVDVRNAFNYITPASGWFLSTDATSRSGQ